MMGISSKLNKTDINVAKNIVEDSFVFDAKRSSLGLLLVYCFCMLLSCLPLNNSTGLSSVFLITNTVILCWYFKIKHNRRYLGNVLHSFCSYLMIQVTALTLPLGIQADDKPIFGKYYFLFVVCYFVLVVFLVCWRSNRLIRNYLIEKNIFTNQKSKGKKLNIMITRISLAVVMLAFLSVGIYRTTKSFWITNNIGVNEITINNKWLGLVFLVLLVLAPFIFLMVYSVLPMLLFDVEMIASGIIVHQHSEIFRVQYGYTKEEWYGDE